MKELFITGTMTPCNPTDVIGAQFEKFDFGRRSANDRLTQAEREYLQQRDGSGNDQRMLSVTHAKPTRKVHSNHGEEFTDSAVITIDLALIDRASIYDIHLVESHPAKTSLARKDQNKTAAEERVLYVYSAEKNRETLLTSIPVAAVVAVTVPGFGATSLYAAKRLYNVEFDKQELEKERLEKARQEKAERDERQAQQRRDAESVQNSLYAKAIRELQTVADTKNAQKKLKSKSKQLEALWADTEGYLEAYEAKAGKPIQPSLIMFSTLEEILALVKL